MMMLLWSSKYTEINACCHKGLRFGVIDNILIGRLQDVRADRTILCDVLTSPYLFILLINSSSLSEVSAIAFRIYEVQIRSRLSILQIYSGPQIREYPSIQDQHSNCNPTSSCYAFHNSW